MLIIEGPDCVGKTTIATKLAATLTSIFGPVARIKFGMESAGKMSSTYLLNRINRATVCDRMHMSEVIYALVARNTVPMLSAADVTLISDLIQNTNGFVVNVIATPDAYDRLLEEHHGRGEDFDKEACRRVNAAYSLIGPGGIPNDVDHGGLSQNIIEALRLYNVPFTRSIHVGLVVRLSSSGEIEYVSDKDVASIAHRYARAQGWG